MNEEINFNQAEVKQYHDRADNRSQAIALLTKLKAKETNMITKIVWRNQQPTLVSTTRSEFNTQGYDLGNGYPATEQYDRVPSAWEGKLESKNRQSYTLEETQTMNFKTSGHLPAHYYMDESALEAYVESLTKEK